MRIAQHRALKRKIGGAGMLRFIVRHIVAGIAARLPLWLKRWYWGYRLDHEWDRLAKQGRIRR